MRDYNGGNMDNENYEVKLKQATLDKLHSKISQLNLERERLELEKNEYLLKSKKNGGTLKQEPSYKVS